MDDPSGPPDELPQTPLGALEAARAQKKRRLWVLLAPIVALSVAATLADWFAAAVITERPLLQVFLNPRIRYLALAATNVDATAWFLLAFVRLILTDPLYYLLGWWYGDDALRWMERNWAESAGVVRTMERWFAKASYAVVLIAPNGIVCLLAGATRMRVRVFIVLNVVGTVGRLVLVYALAQSIRGPLEDVLGFIDRYQWWLVGLSVAIGLYMVLQRTRGPRNSNAGDGPGEETAPGGGEPTVTDPGPLRRSE